MTAAARMTKVMAAARMTERAKMRVALLRVTSNILRSSSNNWSHMSLLLMRDHTSLAWLKKWTTRTSRCCVWPRSPQRSWRRCGNGQSKQTNAGIPLKILWKLFPPPQSWETGESTRLRRRRNIGRFLPCTYIFFRKVINSLKMVVTSWFLLRISTITQTLRNMSEFSIISILKGSKCMLCMNGPIRPTRGANRTARPFFLNWI